jgi:hypothetical protein
MDQEFALLTVTYSRDNTYDVAQYQRAAKAFANSNAFLRVADGVYFIKIKEAFPLLVGAYSVECRYEEFRLRFAVVPCSPTVFGAFLGVEAKALAAFGLTHLETPIPAAQPLR